MVSDGAGGSGRTLQYRYQFLFDDGTRRTFLITLDHASLQLLQEPRPGYPAWTELGYKQCPNCPLDVHQHPRCPVAVNLVDVVEFLKDRLSIDEVSVEVEFHDRRYSKRTSLQQAAGSLIGIFTVTSGCPILNKLRPMVDTHLPFQTSDESTYRTISMYLMAQYFLTRRGLAADWELKDLVGFLARARETNAAFCRRLQAIGIKDASLNALSNLNAMGEITSLSIETSDLRRLEKIFAEHYRA
jgi:hypothetical protein